DPDARRESEAGAGPGPEAHAGPATPPAREPRFAVSDEAGDDEPGADAGEPAAGPRRRRSRRGGRGRDGEPPGGGTRPAASPRAAESAVGEAEPEGKLFSRRSEVPAEPDDADAPGRRLAPSESFEVPAPAFPEVSTTAIVRAPAGEAAAPATGRLRAFGRGR